MIYFSRNLKSKTIRTFEVHIHFANIWSQGYESFLEIHFLFPTAAKNFGSLLELGTEHGKLLVSIRTGKVMHVSSTFYEIKY